MSWWTQQQANQSIPQNTPSKAQQPPDQAPQQDNQQAQQRLESAAIAGKNQNQQPTIQAPQELIQGANMSTPDMGSKAGSAWVGGLESGATSSFSGYQAGQDIAGPVGGIVGAVVLGGLDTAGQILGANTSLDAAKQAENLRARYQTALDTYMKTETAYAKQKQQKQKEQGAANSLASDAQANATQGQQSGQLALQDSIAANQNFRNKILQKAA